MMSFLRGGRRRTKPSSSSDSSNGALELQNRSGEAGEQPGPHANPYAYYLALRALGLVNVSRSEPPQSYTITLDEHEIFEATQHHKNFTLNATKIQHLKQYNDPSPYGLREAKGHLCLKAEIKRLVDAVYVEGPFPFDSKGLLSPELDDAYEEIVKIADQIRVAMDIMRLDNASISLRYCLYNNLQESVNNYTHANRRLRGRFADDSEQGHVYDSAPKIVGSRDHNAHLYGLFVDYITASVARTLMRTAVSDYWSQQVLSCLASCAVKLKTLSSNIKEFAQTSIRDAAYTIDEIQNTNKEKNSSILAASFTLGTAESSSSNADPLNTETDDASDRYYEEKTFYNRRFWLMMRRILNDILLPETRHAKPDCFQVHNSVYRAGIDGPLTIVTCDRLGEISASGERFDVHTLYTSLELALKNVNHVHLSSQEVTRRGVDRTGTLVVCEWPKEFDGKPFYVTKADDVLSIMVPLALSAATTAATLGNLISFAASYTSEDDPVKRFEGPPKDFHASFDISTFTWREKERQLHREGIKNEHADVVTFAKSPLSRGIQPNTDLGLLLGKYEDDSPEKLSAQRKSATATTRYMKDKARMEQWVVSEDSIRLNCRSYVNTVVIILLLFIGGSLAIPFTVRDRIVGVDPFNITLYSWLLSGLFLLIANRNHGNDWPWHHFIAGHVICRTLEEVCVASNIDDQTILSFLLLHEGRNVLRTKGPYNALFARKAADVDAAFSINIPAHISTIMASGFIVLKIVNITGEHLIFLDVRRTRNDVTYMSTIDRTACLDLEQFDEPGPDKGELVDFYAVKYRKDNPRRRQRAPLRVDKVLGLYVGDCSSYFG